MQRTIDGCLRAAAGAACVCLSVYAPAMYGQACSSNTQVGCLNSGAVCSPVNRGQGAKGHCTTRPGMPPGERECDCLGSIPPPPPLLDPRCSDRTATGKFQCTIDEPNVRQRETVYSNVVFAPGDILDVKADGCVQTGGAGATWKRYVNPSGPNSGALYHGLIRIPTGTRNSELVAINTVMGKRLVVTGAGVPASQLVLHLGYQDDDYSDNGYNDHDDGTEDQCKSDAARGIDGGPAHVTVTVYRGVPTDNPDSHFDFDVLGTTFDPNGFLLNPHWSWQQKPGNQGKIPDTSMCHEFSVRNTTLGVPNEFKDPSFADCTDQADTNSVDRPIDLNATICNYGTVPYLGSTFAGHVNWFPVTVEGNSFWGDQGVDDDNTFTFISGQAGDPLSVNGRHGLHVEFDSDETTDNFTSAAWQPFKDAVHQGDNAKAQQFFEGHTILTGMFGLDGEHNLKAELHPLFAMATRRNALENSAADESWLIFVRNQGDEGFCSSNIWQAGFEDYTFRLPWRQGMASVDVDRGKTQFTGTDGASGPVVTALPPPAPNAGVFVTFHLGPPVNGSSVIEVPASRPFINGALHLIWSKGSSTPGATAAVTARPAAANLEEAGDTEDAVQAAIAKLAASDRAKVTGSRAIANTRRAALHPLPPPGPVKPVAKTPEFAKASRLHAIKAGPAARKAERDAQEVRALCDATRNQPAGLAPKTCGGNTRKQ